MDLKKYEVLLKVIERGSINNVSYDLGYTHSGISKMLNSMELELGFQIIKRNNKGITLTPEGEMLLPQIRKLIRENETLEQEIALVNGIEKGTVRIGCFPTTAFVIMPDIFKYFSAQYPNIKIEVLEEQSIERIEQWLNRGIIDVGLISHQPYHRFHWFWEINDEYVALMPKNHELSKNDVVNLEDIFKHKILLFKSHKGLDQDVVNLLQYIDVDLDTIRYTTNSDFMAIRLIESNGFVALIPKLIASYAVDHFDVEYRPVSVELNRSIGFAVKSKDEVSPSVKRFIKCVKENME